MVSTRSRAPLAPKGDKDRRTSRTKVGRFGGDLRPHPVQAPEGALNGDSPAKVGVDTLVPLDTLLLSSEFGCGSNYFGSGLLSGPRGLGWPRVGPRLGQGEFGRKQGGAMTVSTDSGVNKSRPVEY